MEGNEPHSSETGSKIPTTLQEAKDLLPQDDQWDISNMWLQDQGKEIANAIQLGNATGLSDGSYKNNRGTAACVMEENNNEDSRIYAVHDTPGEMSNQSPYRLELGGISMMLAMLRCIVQYYGITKGSIRLGLDGKKAMEQAGGTFPLYPTQRSFDMLVDIRAKIQQLPISVTLFWVEGRQIVKHGHQSYLGTLNDQCDTMAKIYWSITARQQPKPNQLVHDSPLVNLGTRESCSLF